MRISYFMIISILIMAEGQAMDQMSSPVDLSIIEPHVFRNWKTALGRLVPPECGISDLKNVPNPPVGRLAESNAIIQALGGTGRNYKIVEWVHNLISKYNKYQPCFRDIVFKNNKPHENMIIRYQYPIIEKNELKEVEQWNNNLSFNDYIKYGEDSGFLVVEYLYEMRDEQWLQKAFRISADWEGLTDRIKKIHRSHELSGGKRIKRAKPQ